MTESGTIYLLGAEADPASGNGGAEAVCGIVAQMLSKGEHSKGEHSKGEAARRQQQHGSDPAVCSVCLEPCEPAESNWDLTACKHAFHVECLSRWVALRAEESAQAKVPTMPPSCPDCRHPLSSSRLRLFDACVSS